MKNQNFCHLHVHSEYSLLDSVINIKEYAKLASEMGFPAISINDHGNVDGAIKFQRECKANNINSVIACELYVVENPLEHNNKERRFHINVFCKNHTGWTNLLKLITKANLTGFYKRPRVSYQDILENCEGLIIGTACIETFLWDKAGMVFFENLLDIIPDDIYLEFMPHCTKEQVQTNKLLLGIQEKYNVRGISTNDSHYILKEDAKVQEILLAIQTGKKWSDPGRWKFDKAYKLYLKSADEMIAEFEKQGVLPRNSVIRAMRNTIRIAEECCEFVIPKREIALPCVPGLEGVNEDKYLEQLVIQGYYERIGEFFDPEHEKRIDEELAIIKKLNFSRYFLIVHDLMTWARNHGIHVNSRGSCGCSAVAHLMAITNVNPLLYDLPFTRFINEDRVDMVDIDLDFPSDKREMVINRLRELYGENNIANISTFGKMKGRSALRDVSRVFEIDDKEVDEAAKTIEENVTELVDKKHPFNEKYPEIVKYAQRLEGKERNAGKHASGIIVSNSDLRNGARCSLAVRKSDIAVNWAKEDAEYCGLMKVDILGVATLSVIANTIKLIKENYNLEISPETIPMNDPKIFETLSKGESFVGIFQMGYAVQQVVKDAGVSSISEWSDAVALGRPGPLESGMTENYIKRKHGEDWEKKHPLYEEILKKTHSVIAYQEDVISIFNKVAGLPYSTADQIRRIIGRKRDASEFEPYKEVFREGCLKQGTMTEEEVEEFWDGLLKHARYSFNKCLSGDTIITKCENNEQYKIRVLDAYHEALSGVDILQMNQDSTIGPGKLHRIYYNGVAQVFNVHTESGFNIKATLHHRLLTQDGYKVVWDLKIGLDSLVVKSRDQVRPDLIIRIEYAGQEDVYDLEMATKDHNFIANGIISHNSHSLSYAITGYQCLYLKTYYPSEFLCSMLTHDKKTPKPEIINEATKIGLEIIPPKIGISDANKWIAKDGKLYTPFVEIMGVGDKMALEITKGGRFKRKKVKGFYVTDETPTFTPSVQKILTEIDAFNPNGKLPKDAFRYFDFSESMGDMYEMYPNLVAMLEKEYPKLGTLNSTKDGILKSAKRGEFELSLFKEQKPFPINKKLLECRDCGLCQESIYDPVPCSPSRTNLMLCGEAAGKTEAKGGEGFIGKAGDVLWPELRKYDLVRSDFHVSNVAKCFPAKTRTPQKEHIEACEKWLDEELEFVKPCIILALGGTAMYRFSGIEKGITQKSGTIEWNEKYGCYVVYCVHPASTFHSSGNQVKFEEGIRFYNECLKRLGGI